MKSNFKKMIFAILIVLVSNGIAYSQKVKVSISPKSIDFGTIPLNTTKEVPVCITNKGEIDIRIYTLGFATDNGRIVFFSSFIESSQLVFTLKPNEKLEFFVRFFTQTVGPKSGTLELLAGSKTFDYSDPLSFVTDTIRISLIGNGTDAMLISEEDTNKEYSLSQNYPNPFNPTTTIKYKIPTDGIVKLTVFDITGKFIQELVNGYKAAGTYYVGFDASSHASGTYFYKLEAGDYKSIQKMMVVK
jgi:hypothetical protein